MTNYEEKWAQIHTSSNYLGEQVSQMSTGIALKAMINHC
jgi:RNA-splicing ligase RtcB